MSKPNECCRPALSSGPTVISLLALAMLLAIPSTVRAQFTPLDHGVENTEEYTGLWFGVWMTASAPKLPIETLVRATKEAVTGGVALKVIARPGSIGRITYEHGFGGSFSPPNLTFYLKASEPLTLRVFQKGRPGSTTTQATTSWKKVDIKTTGVPDYLSFELDAPATREVHYIIDRIGLESTVMPQDLSQATSGPDAEINTSQLIYGAAHLAAFVQRLAAKQPVKIVALGDSVVNGSQIHLGNEYGWNVATRDKFVFSSALARMLESEYGYAAGAIAAHNFGGVSDTIVALRQSAITNKVLTQAGANDLVIIELGGNELVDGATVPQWIARLKQLIGQCRAGGVKHIVFVGLTLEDGMYSYAPQITPALKQLSNDAQIAVLDLSAYADARGKKYSWADSANPSHPDASMHSFIAQMMTAIFNGKHFDTINVGPGAPVTPDGGVPAGDAAVASDRGVPHDGAAGDGAVVPEAGTHDGVAPRDVRPGTDGGGPGNGGAGGCGCVVTSKGDSLGFGALLGLLTLGLIARRRRAR